MKKQQGITLIALVITIIVLLILAGVSISMVIGNNGILNQASQAKSETILRSEQEQVELAYLTAKTNRLGGSVTVETLNDALSANQVKANATSGKDKEGNDIILVTFTDTQNKYEVKGEIVTRVETPEKVTIPEGLAVGDTVSYYPSGTYRWLNKYAASATTINAATGLPIEYYDLATGNEVNSSNQDMSISSWKVFSIDESTGQVELVPSSETIRTVKLEGAQGYNNAVKLLNDACSNLYGDSSKGITARSINVEDIEKVMYYEEENMSFIEYYDTYVGAYGIGTDENYQAIEGFSAENSQYPTIYEQEDLSVIKYEGNTAETKIEIGEGLGRSEQEYFIEKNAKGAVSKDASTDGKITTATSLKPYGTEKCAYVDGWKDSRGDIEDIVGLLGDYTSLVLPNGDVTSYWVASRSVYVWDYGQHCHFNVCSMLGLAAKPAIMFTSMDYIDNFYSTGNERGLFPVLTLNWELLCSGSTTEWAVE